MVNEKIRVLVAGIGGASLGTEIIKSLQSAGSYMIYGCDISGFAFGHYQAGIQASYIVDRKNYISDIGKLCRQNKIQAIIPGGEEPAFLLGESQDKFNQDGIHIVSNTHEVIQVCSNKATLFSHLERLNVSIPQSIRINSPDDLEDMVFPCVIKPATGTGGSSFVFLAANKHEAELYATYLLNLNQIPLAQEYISHDEGEFTIGVLHLPDGSLIGSIALQRMFHAKLSVLTQTAAGLISSGYSQGLIDDFPEIRKQAENIAQLLKSRGPLNIQGRLRNGVLVPFEINPRVSASTYLRTMAGFNELDISLKNKFNRQWEPPDRIRPGYYLRSLDEVYISENRVLS